MQQRMGKEKMKRKALIGTKKKTRQMNYCILLSVCYWLSELHGGRSWNAS